MTDQPQYLIRIDHGHIFLLNNFFCSFPMLSVIEIIYNNKMNIDVGLNVEEWILQTIT